jgi:hypothetical protein
MIAIRTKMLNEPKGHAGSETVRAYTFGRRVP